MGCRYRICVDKEGKMNEILTRKIARRTFLKAAAATTAVAAVGDRLFGGPVSALVESKAAALQAAAEESWIPTFCNICDENCGILVRTVNGVAVKVDGNPDHPRSRGKVCGRANAYPMYLYNPYRVKAPMKRTNPEKGLGVDAKWQEISWDEALNLVADKMKAIHEENPSAYWPHSGHRSMGNLWSSLTNVFGTKSNLGSVNFCTGGALHLSSYWMTGLSAADVNVAYANWTMQMGGRHLGQKGAPLHNRIFSQAKDRGIKVVDLCPIIAPSDPNPDEWLPIKPGTDAAFFLSMIDVALNELNTFDVEFVKHRTNGPYLIQVGGSEDGLYMRADEPKVKDVTRLDQEFGPPLIWDPVDQAAKPFNDATIKDFALEGTYTVNGVQCRPAFQLLKDHVTDYPPEKVSEITTIPAETIRRITKELVEAAQIGSTITIEGEEFPYRPASIGFSKGLSGSRGLYTQFTPRIMNVLIGAIDCPGGLGDRFPTLEENPADGTIQLESFIYTPIKFPPPSPSMNELYPVRYNFNTLAWYAVAEPDKYYLQNPPKAYAFNGANILGNSFSPPFVAEQMKKIPFIWGTPYHFDDVAEMADVLLPPHSHLETYGGANEPRQSGDMDCTRYTMVFIEQPVVKPVFNTLEVDDIIIQLADRIGILNGEHGLYNRINRNLEDPYKLDVNGKYTWEEIFDRQLKSEYGADTGLAYLKEHGYKILAETKPEDLFAINKEEYKNTRVPVYFEYLVWCGRQHRQEYEQFKDTFSYRPSNEHVFSYYKGLPEFLPKAYENVPAEFDLYAVHYKTMLHSMATFMDNAWITEHTKRYDPYTMNILIHPDTAQRRGIKSGDLIWVESPFGKTQGEATVTNLTRPDTVAIGGDFGAQSPDLYPPAREGAQFNTLCWASEEWRDPITGNQENTMKVKVYKA
jgi:anaerobic selenocysteine-containing dehydrogenase